MRPSGSGRSAGPGRFVLLAGLTLLAALAGYAGYVAYPRFGLPPAAGAGLLLLAAGAGVASFFSPCSFPLLLTLLSREVRDGEGRAIASGLRFAVPFSAGALAFILLAGAFLGLGGSAFAARFTFTSPQGIITRIVVGLVLVFLGLVQTEVLPFSFHAVERATRPVAEAQARFRRRHPVAGFAVFGFGYLLAGFG